MRKIALKKLNPDRHKIIKSLREKNTLVEIITRGGKEVVLNPYKHFLYKKPYKNQEYQKELWRFMRKKGEEVND